MTEPQVTKELSFEQALQALENIVEQMSKQTLSLDELIVLYEDGIRYLHLCQQDLETAEMKINLLNERIKQYDNGEKQNG